MRFKGNLDPVGPSVVKTLSDSSLDTYNLKLQIKETSEILEIFFLETWVPRHQSKNRTGKDY